MTASRRGPGGPTGAVDPRTETEALLGVAGTLRLRHPTPRVVGVFGPVVSPEFCGARCDREGCDVDGGSVLDCRRDNAATPIEQLLR